MSTSLGTGRVGIQQWVQILSEQLDAKKFVNVRDTSQLYVTDKQITDFGLPQMVTEAGPGVMDARVPLYSQNVTPIQYVLLFGISDIAQYTDQYDIFSGYKENIATSFTDLETLAIANLFNNGFSSSYTGIDTVALFSTAHPYQSYPTWSNRPSVDLAVSATNLETMVSNLRATNTARSRKMRIRDGLRWIVSTTQEFPARRIVTSLGQAGTMNLNERNEIGKRVIEVEVIEELSAANAHFLVPQNNKRHGLYYLQQKPFTVRTTPGTFDVFTRTMYVSCDESFAVSWDHAQGVYGTNP